MKCKVCGYECGTYTLCYECNRKRNAGEIIKCDKCGKWHYKGVSCEDNMRKHLYDLKYSLISKTEMPFFKCIKKVLPKGYLVLPQANLAAFIYKPSKKPGEYISELFKNIDFIITDEEYRPKVLIEINDKSHETKKRKERDIKVANICKKAGIPIINLWTSFEPNEVYIKERIYKALESLPYENIEHTENINKDDMKTVIQDDKFVDEETVKSEKKKGCYIATCVYGTYNCPEVWTLRRFRDLVIAKKWFGRFFINTYYVISPLLVKYFGNISFVRSIWKKCLNKIVSKLNAKGIKNTPYCD